MRHMSYFVQETRGGERTWKEIEVGCTPILDSWRCSENAMGFAAAMLTRMKAWLAGNGGGERSGWKVVMDDVRECCAWTSMRMGTTCHKHLAVELREGTRQLGLTQHEVPKQLRWSSQQLLDGYRQHPQWPWP